jgi:uncharacterized BrkB/YihY/UPF0761 family membrane protein
MPARQYSMSQLILLTLIACLVSSGIYYRVPLELSIVLFVTALSLCGIHSVLKSGESKQTKAMSVGFIVVILLLLARAMLAFFDLG